MARIAAGTGGVIACSALKRAHRDRLREAGGPALRIGLLDPPREALVARLAASPDHLMPASLLDRQLATLERPEAGEGVVAILYMPTVKHVCDLITTSLAL